MLVEQAATMAAATNTTQGTPMEEENPTLVVAEEEPPKKYEATMTPTTEHASVTPLEDENPTLVVEEVPKIVEATLVVEKEAEVVKKEVVGGKEKENEGLERKDWHYEGLEAKNGKEEGSRGGDDHIRVEEEVGILGVVEAIKNDGSEKMTKDMVHPALVLVVEKKLENSELEDGTCCLTSLDAVEGGDKGELMKEEQQKEGSIIEETMVEGDANSIVIEKEKPEPKGQKGEDVGFGGGDGGTLDEQKVTEVSSLEIEVVKPKDKVAPFPQANNAISYDKESTDDTEVVGGQETPKESIGNDTNVEDETIMSEQGIEMAILAMNDGNIDDVDLASADSVPGDSIGKKDADDQATTTKAEEEVDATLEEKVADNVSDDVEFAIVGKEKQKLEDKENEEVGLGGGAGKLNEAKDIEVLVLSVEAIELEDKLAPLAETNEKLCYEMEGSSDIVVVNKGSAEEITPASVFCVLKDISKKEHNAEGRVTTSDAEESSVLVEMSTAEKVSDDAKSLLEKKGKPKLVGVKGEKAGSSGRAGGELDEEKEVELSVVSIILVEPGKGAMVVNDRSIEEAALASEDNVLVDSPKKKQNIEGQITANEEKEKVHVVREAKVTDTVLDDREFHLAEEGKGEPKHVKSEEIGSVGGNGGQLDEEKDVEDSTVIVEFEHKLAPSAETNENLGNVKEGSDDVMYVNKESVEEVTPASAYSVLEAISKKEHNAESQAISSEAGEEVGVVVDMHAADKVVDDANSLLAMEEERKLEGVKYEEVESGVWDDIQLDKEKQVEVSVSSIMFVEQEACEMEVNNRSKEEVDLAFEDIVLIGSRENKQNTKFDVAEDEKAQTKGDKGGELDTEKDVEVMTVSIEATELEDRLGHLPEANKEVGYVKEGSDDIMVGIEETVEEVTPASSYGVREDISMMENNVVGQATPSEVEEMGVVMEMYVADKVPDDAKSLLIKEKNPKLQGVKGKEAGSSGELDAEKETEVSIVGMLFVEPEADAKVVNDKIIDEVALASEDSVLMDSLETKQNVEGQTTTNEVKEEVRVVMEAQVTDTVLDDIEFDMAEKEDGEPEREKSEEIGSVGGNGGQLDNEKDFEDSTVIVELEHTLAPSAETNENLGYAKEGSDNVMYVNKESVEEVTPASAYSVLEAISKKEHDAESQAIASEAEEEVGVVVDMHVAYKVVDDANSLLAMEEEAKLEGVKDEEVESGVWDGVQFDKGKQVEVSVASIVFVEQEACEMEVNNISKEEVDLAFEDIVLISSPENEPNTESDMAEDEKAQTKGDKGGELEKEKDVEVMTVSIEATELEDMLGRLPEANKEVGYVKEGSDDTMVRIKGTVEEDTPASSYGVHEDISMMKNNVVGQATPIEVEEMGVVMELYIADKMSDDAKYLLIEEKNPKLQGVKGEEAGSSGELDAEKETEVSVVGMLFVEPEADAKVVNDKIIDEVALASEDIVLVDSLETKQNVEGQTTTNEVKEEVHVVMEAQVTNTVLDDIEFDMAEEHGEPEREKSEEIGSVGRNGGQLDNEKDVEDSTVIVELEHRLAPSAETNENLGYAKEGSDDVMYVNKESVEEVTPPSAYSVLKATSKKEHNAESQAIASEAEKEIGVVVDMHAADKVVDGANSLLAMVEEPKLGVKDEEVESADWDGVQLDKEKQVEVSVASIVFVEQEACEMEVNNRRKEEVDLAFEDIVLISSPENKQNTESDMAEDEKAETKDDKGGELDKEKDVEVMTISIEATELQDRIGHLAEANKEVSYAEEGSDDIMVGIEGTVEEVTPASSYGVCEDIFKMENNNVGQATPIEVKEMSVVMEMYVADKVADDAKYLLIEEKNPELQDVKGEEVGSSGELDGEKETEVSVVGMLFGELEAGAKVVNDKIIEEVALASEDSVLVDSPEMKQNVEGQTTTNDVKEKVHVVMEAKITDTVLDDREFYMAEEGKGKPKDETSGQFVTIKDIVVSVFSIEAIELEHKLASLAETNENFGYATEENDIIVDLNKGSVEEVTLSSVYSVGLEGISKKEYNVEGEATARKREEEVGVVVDMHAADMVPDDAKSLAMGKSKLKCVKGVGVESGVQDHVELNEEKEVQVSIASIVFNEQEACAMEVNDRSTEEVDLAFEESAETEGEKGGELDNEKYVEVFTVIVEATELENKLGPLAEANEEVGCVKEGSDNIMVGMKGNVEEVNLASSYCVLEDTSKKENNVEGQTTASEAEDIGVVVEMYVADKVQDDAKFLLVKEENLELEGVNGEEAGSGGELDEEKQGEVSMASIVVVEPKDKITSLSEANDGLGEKKENSDRVVAGQEEAPKESSEAGTMVVNDGSMDEVALGSAYHVLKNSPNIEGQATASETREEICVATEVEVTNKVSDDTKHVVTEEEKTILVEGEKGKEVGSIGGDGGELDVEKEVEVFTVIVDVVELEDNVAHLTETSGRPNTKKGSDDEVVVGDARAHKESTWNDIVSEGEVAKSEPESEASTVVMNDGSVEEVEASAKSVLENSSWKEHNVEGQATTSEVEEEVGVIMEAEVADDAKFVLAKEEELELQGEKGGKVGFGDGDGGILCVGKELEVSVVSTTVVEPKDKTTSFSKSNDELDFEKEANNDIVVMGDETPKESTENDTYVEDDATNLEQLSEMSIVGVNDGSADEIAPVSADYVLKYSPMKEKNTKRHATSSETKEELDLVVQGKVMDKELNNAESVVAEENKVELEGDKGEKVGFLGGDGDESDKEKKIEVSVVNVEAIEVEGKLASIDEKKIYLSYETKASNDIVVVGDEQAPEQSTKNDADIEKETSKPEPSSEASIVVVNDETLEELAPTSVESVLEGSPIKEVNFEGQAIANEVMEDVDVGKPSKVENIAATVQHLGVDKSIKVENIVGAVKGVDVEKLIKVESVTAADIDGTLSLELPPKPTKENNDAEEIKGGTDVIHREEEFDDGSKIEVVPGYEDGCGDKDSEYDDESNSDTSPTLVAILESNEAMKQTMKEHVEGSSNGSVSNSRDFTNSMDGQIMLDASKDDRDEKGFDSTAHTSLLKAANGASSYENVIISSQDGSEILTMDRPTGLGSLTPSLRPTTPDLLVLSELAVTTDPTEMVEEESKLHDKVELIRVKFMRLVYSLGGTPKEMVVTQVLYRLGLVEGIIHGRQTRRAFSLDNAWKKALTFEEEGKDDLNFSCNILVLGKTGVGKSATINSIFGEEKSKTDAFNSATTSVQEIVGDVHGVKIRIIDTPGLQTNVMDQGSNRKILAAVKKYTKKCPPDIVLYVDRLDCLSRDLNDLPLLKTITNVFGPSIWFNAIVALTHAASALEDLNGAHMTYEVLMAQTTHIIQQSIRHATGDMNLMNPVAFVENHSSCQRNHEDQKVLPNGQSWRHHMLLLCYSSKILSEANSLLKLNDPNPEKPFGFCFGSLPLPFLMSSLLELRAHPKLSASNKGDSDIELDKYFDEYDCKVRPPPSFDSGNPTYRYRFMEPTSTVIARPVLDVHGWDHDCGYDGVSVEETLAILNMFPANVAVEITKDKKEFSIHLESSIAAKHGENASSLARFDIQTVGRQLAYILHGETKIKKNKTTGGFLVTFLGDTVATGLKVEDQISLGKRLSLAASTGAIQAQGDTTYGANLEARLKDKAKPIGKSLSTLGFSLMKWRQELALGANLHSQISIGRGSRVAFRLGLNNKLNGQISVKTSTSEQVQIALLGLVPIAASIYRSLQPSKPSSA